MKVRISNLKTSFKGPLNATRFTGKSKVSNPHLHSLSTDSVRFTSNSTQAKSSSNLAFTSLKMVEQILKKFN